MLSRGKKKPTALRPLRGAAHKNSGRGPARDEDYKAWIRTLPCLIGRVRPEMAAEPWGPRTEAAHTGPHGHAQKASDYTCIPLCRKHHHELDHQIGKSFWRKYGLDRVKLIEALRAEYERTKG